MSSSATPYQRVLPLLEAAETIASGYSGGSSSHFASAEALTKAIHIGLLKLKFRDTSDVPAMKKWFAPEGDWNSLIGPEGTSIGKQLHELLPEITLTHFRDVPLRRRATVGNWLAMLVQAFFEAF